MTELSIGSLWTMYADIMFRDNTISSSKGHRILSRTLAQGAFYAGARSVLKVLTHILDKGELDELTIERHGSGGTETTKPRVDSAI